jgi:hypothetical protein
MINYWKSIQVIDECSTILPSENSFKIFLFIQFSKEHYHF